jgi:GNAT superfamily N-acetyltransferase
MQSIDKQGKLFEVKTYSPEDYAFLERMYLSFYPKGKFQGMPPLKDEASRRWIKDLLETGENFLAWQDGKTVGHVVLLPDFAKKDAEYLIFVSHPNRGRGIGSQLTRVAIQHVRDLGLTSIWLTVGATNFRAIGLYKKFGFIDSNMGVVETERKMALRL